MMTNSLKRIVWLIIIALVLSMRGAYDAKSQLKNNMRHSNDVISGADAPIFKEDENMEELKEKQKLDAAEEAVEEETVEEELVEEETRYEELTKEEIEEKIKEGAQKVAEGAEEFVDKAGKTRFVRAIKDGVKYWFTPVEDDE